MSRFNIYGRIFFPMLLMGAATVLATPFVGADNTSVVALPPDDVLCTDIYPRSAVNVSLFSPTSGVVTGTTMEVPATFSNTTGYSVDDAVLYVQVYEIDDEQTNLTSAVLIDQFVAIENLSLDAGEEYTDSFSWSVPHWLQTGTYVISTAVIINDVHYLSGSPVSPRIPGNTLQFQVSGDSLQNEKSINVLQDQVSVNGQRLTRSSELLVVDASGQANISIPVVSTVSENQTIQASWQLYKYNQITTKHELLTEQDTIQLASGEEQNVGNSFSIQEHGSYLVVAEIRTPLSERYVVNVPFAAAQTFDPYISFVVEEQATEDQPALLHVCIDQHGLPVNQINHELAASFDFSPASQSSQFEAGLNSTYEPQLHSIALPTQNFTRATATVSLTYGGVLWSEQTRTLLCRGGSCLSSDAESDDQTQDMAVQNLLYLIGITLFGIVVLSLFLSAPLLRRLFKR